MQSRNGLVEQFKDNVIHFFLRSISNIFRRRHRTFHIILDRNITIRIGLCRKQESVIDTGYIERIVIILLVAEPESLDKLAVLGNRTVVIKMLPTGSRPTVIISIRR